MSRFRNQHNWNEFRWENEIRRDERRINCYFAELASCIDLPGEEEIIAGLIAENTDLVPTVSEGNPGPLRGWSYLVPHDEEEEDEDYSARRPEQAVINLLDSMACQWNMAWVCEPVPETIPAGLGISCAFGKLLARMADFADADGNADKGLKITLGKRTIADLNELADALKFIAANHPALRELALKHLENLAQILDRVISLLSAAKKE